MCRFPIWMKKVSQKWHTLYQESLTWCVKMNKFMLLLCTHSMCHQWHTTYQLRMTHFISNITHRFWEYPTFENSYTTLPSTLQIETCKFDWINSGMNYISLIGLEACKEKWNISNLIIVGVMSLYLEGLNVWMSSFGLI